ncbi:MFS transporter [Paenibacillus sp. tmac-D7]|uniref:MFS transporter n=1 Tax=Paenibacillus sp. tmac-D7 TaxID=2591462 RepID=UPI001143849F|nr:MFS transporter [Paenibacillus sp. tmac-D7]
MANRKFWVYENKLLLILSLGWGFLFFDRLAVNFLMPFIIKDVPMSNTQISLIVAGFSLTWALGGYFGGYFADRLGKRKVFLAISVLFFSLCSFMTGVVTGFLFLLFIRMLMGLVEGPFFPTGASILAVESSESRRGFNLGFLQNFSSNFLGGVLGPIVLVAVAIAIGWRNTFLLTLIPGLIVAFLIWRYVREPKTSNESESISTDGNKKDENVRVRDLFKYRNIVLCIIIGIFFIPWYTLVFTFAPLYLVQAKGVSPDIMSYVMSAVGISAAVWGFVVPALSDRWGRKPAMITFSFISMLGPLSILFFNGPFWMLMILVIIGCAGPGPMALFMSIIPAETIPRKYIGAAVGLTMGVGELIGGVGIVTLSGVAADHYGIMVPLLMSAAFALISALVSLFLIETSPIKVKAKREAELRSSTVSNI